MVLLAILAIRTLYQLQGSLSAQGADIVLLVAYLTAFFGIYSRKKWGSAVSFALGALDLAISTFYLRGETMAFIGVTDAALIILSFREYRRISVAAKISNQKEEHKE